MPGQSPSAWASVALLFLGGCAAKTPSSAPWSVFPLPRSAPHDGLAVVSQPDGYGLHIFLETDTADPEVCKPRWILIRLDSSMAVAQLHLFRAGIAPGIFRGDAAAGRSGGSGEGA